VARRPSIHERRTRRGDSHRPVGPLNEPVPPTGKAFTRKMRDDALSARDRGGEARCEVPRAGR